MEIEFVFAAPPGTGAAQLEKIGAIGKAYARNAVQVAPAESVQAFWCARFGVARQADWPAAPYRLDAASAGPDCWLCADPVYLQFDRDRLLFDPQALHDLEQPEADELLALLNGHFASDGLRFIQAGPREWLLRVPRVLDLAAPSPLEAHGLPAAQALPGGADAAWARRLSNEIQMLLHGAPANARREESRQWPVNSLWLWGGGTRPSGATAIGASRDVMLLSDGNHVRAWAQAAGAQAAPLPGTWPGTFSGQAAKVLIDLTELAAHPNWDGLLQANWLNPAANARRTQNLTFSLTLLMARHSFTTKLYRSDLFHFFCRKSLAHYVDNIQNQTHT